MEFKEIKGNQYIILEPNEKVYITTLGETQNVKIINDGSGLEIVGNSSVVHSIRGQGMLEKVYIPPVVSSKEVIEKCDKWLEMFKKVHDRLKELRNRNIMCLSFEKSFSDTNTGRTIELKLENAMTRDITQEGISITIDENNKAVYDYLVANVLDYFVTSNYGPTTKVGKNTSSDTLYAMCKGGIYPICARLKTLNSSLLGCSDIVSAIIENHDLGISSQPLIDELRSKISDQQIDDRMDHDTHYSEAIFEDIMTPALEQALSLTKQLKK